MKKRSIIIVSAAAVVVALSWVPISRSIAWRHDYAEAEPLQKLVWPMAYEMKRFCEEHGRPPASIEEITQFSKDYDFSRLGKYRPEFTQDGDRLFYLRVNERFSFQIDKSFTPGWADFTGVLDKPRDSTAHRVPNPRSALDAGMALCLQIGHHWAGASESERSPSPTPLSPTLAPSRLHSLSA